MGRNDAVVLLPVVDVAVEFRWDVLPKSSAHGNVDDLHSPADSEDGNVALISLAEQQQFESVALVVHLFQFFMRFVSIIGRMYIRSACHQQSVNQFCDSLDECRVVGRWN